MTSALANDVMPEPPPIYDTVPASYTAPWLAGVPQITDSQAELAERDELTPTQERKLARAVDRIKALVRQAADAWFREHG